MRREHLLQPMDHARDVLRRLADATPHAHWWHQPVPGANHVAWTLGHLAWADDLVLRALGEPGGLPSPPTWEARFAWRTTPAPEPGGQPGEEPGEQPGPEPEPEELLRVLDDRRAALRRWIAALPEERLAETPPADLAGWVPVLGALPGALAHHDGMHAGQLQVVRKSLGLAPVFM